MVKLCDTDNRQRIQRPQSLLPAVLVTSSPPRRRGWLESGWLSTSASPSSWSSLPAVTQLAVITPPGPSIQHTEPSCDSQQTGGVCSSSLPRPTQVTPAGCGEGGARALHRDTAPLSVVTRSLTLTVANIAVFYNSFIPEGGLLR